MPPVSQRNESNSEATLETTAYNHCTSCPWSQQSKAKQSSGSSWWGPAKFQLTRGKREALSSRAQFRTSFHFFQGCHTLLAFCPVSLIPMIFLSVHLIVSETVGVVFIFRVKYKLRQFDDGGLITIAVTNYPCLLLGLFSLPSLTHTHTPLTSDFSL